MKNNVKMLFVALCCTLLVAGGCAKHELVKKDDQLAPAATAAAKPLAAQETAKAPAVSQAPVKESVAQDTLSPVPQGGELKSALEKIYFDLDAYTLSDQARATLARDAELMKKYSFAKVRIEGNCDERGSDEYNLALGERRAKSAMNYLVTMGVPEKNLSVMSYGKEKPAEPGHDEASWAKNRRDDFTVISQ